jgi:hypothetical protein
LSEGAGVGKSQAKINLILQMHREAPWKNAEISKERK